MKIREKRNLIKMNKFVLSIFKRTKKTLSNCFKSTRHKKSNISRFKKKRKKCSEKEQKRN